jgi:hypothetical protein
MGFIIEFFVGIENKKRVEGVILAVTTKEMRVCKNIREKHFSLAVIKAITACVTTY